jgi:hypothetical protein
MKPMNKAVRLNGRVQSQWKALEKVGTEEDKAL